MLDALDDQFVDLSGMCSSGTGNEGGTGTDGQLGDVKDRVGVAVRGGRRLGAGRGAG